jgi:hypothetical protein
VNGFTRRIRREGSTVEQRLALLEDDMDWFERNQKDYAEDLSHAETVVKEINERITKVLIALATASVMLAVNMFITLIRG